MKYVIEIDNEKSVCIIPCLRWWPKYSQEIWHDSLRSVIIDSCCIVYITYQNKLHELCVDSGASFSNNKLVSSNEWLIISKQIFVLDLNSYHFYHKTCVYLCVSIKHKSNTYHECRVTWNLGLKFFEWNLKEVAII